MPNYTYLIVGGGMTADAAVHGIREVDRDGSIGVLGAEGHPPYDRPPLSKKLWKGKPLESIWRKTESQGVGRAAVERLGAGGRRPETDRRARSVSPREPQRAVAGLTP